MSFKSSFSTSTSSAVLASNNHNASETKVDSELYATQFLYGSATSTKLRGVPNKQPPQEREAKECNNTRHSKLIETGYPREFSLPGYAFPVWVYLYADKSYEIVVLQPHDPTIAWSTSSNNATKSTSHLQLLCELLDSDHPVANGNKTAEYRLRVQFKKYLDGTSSYPLPMLLFVLDGICREEPVQEIVFQLDQCATQDAYVYHILFQGILLERFKRNQARACRDYYSDNYTSSKLTCANRHFYRQMLRKRSGVSVKPRRQEQQSDHQTETQAPDQPGITLTQTTTTVQSPTAKAATSL